MSIPINTYPLFWRDYSDVCVLFVRFSRRFMLANRPGVQTPTLILPHCLNNPPVNGVIMRLRRDLVAATNDAL